MRTTQSRDGSGSMREGDERIEAERDRLELLEQLTEGLEKPMLVLAFIWLVLLVIDLTQGLNPFFSAINTVIWALFAVDFALKFLLAPRKLAFLRANWLTAISLAAPALRLFRIVRVLRLASVARGARLVRVLGSLNRGLRAMRASMGRRGFGYVLTLSLLVIVVGAAGMYTFENPAEGGGLDSYADALWWTAMILMTTGSEYWPRTAEGRILCIALALYGFGVFGYITASLATFFIGRDAESRESEVAGERVLRDVQAEIRALRAEMEKRER